MQRITEVFDVELSDIIREAFDVRSDSDYDDFYMIAKKDVVEQINNAETFLTIIDEYLENRWNEM